MSGPASVVRGKPKLVSAEPPVIAGKVPPNDLDAEAAVLAVALLKEPEAFARAAEILRPADFFNDANKHVFAAALEVAATGGAPDTITVGARLREQEIHSLAGMRTLAYLAKLVGETPAVAHVEDHARIVRELSRRRELIRTCQRVAAEGYFEVAPDWIETSTRDLAEAAAARALRSSVIDDAWKALEPEALIQPPPPRTWLLRHPTRGWSFAPEGTGDGLLPLGKAGVLAAAGGVGKTTALVQLAVSVATGRKWLSHFDVAEDARGGQVLLALAEEDGEECQRRLYNVCNALRLTDVERTLLVRQLQILPLAGKPVGLLKYQADGRAFDETADLRRLRALLERDANQNPRSAWKLIVLDPLARWAGVAVESDNDAATRFVQVVESLTTVPGNPTVLLAHHSSKNARRAGEADSRGVSGIVDALRWEGQLVAEKGGGVTFRQSKSNYSIPMHEPLALVSEDAVLRATTSADDAAKEAKEDSARTDALHADVLRVVEALRDAGELGSIDAIAHAAGMKLTMGRAAVRLAMARQFIVQGGTSRAPRYVVGDSAPGVPGVCERPPIPPGTSGRPEGTPTAPGFGVRDVQGTSRDVGTLTGIGGQQ